MNYPRSRNEMLEADIRRRGHFVEDAPLPLTGSVTVEIDGHYAIGVDPSLDADRRFDALAHELGHAEYGGCYRRSDPFDRKSRHEARADKWSFYYFLPPAALIEACCHGLNTAAEVAERYDLTPSFVHKAVNYYRLTGVL